MSHVLRNNNIEIRIDLPEENYDFSRFDWTGKIVSVIFRDMEFCGFERIHTNEPNRFGRGLYNEFGIDRALGFDKAEIGGWFHKIGIGLLKKEDPDYDFMRPYQIKPAQFNFNGDHQALTLECISDEHFGYSYKLIKNIRLLDEGFIIEYKLINTGSKPIITSEYVHNFLAIGNELINENYELKFPFPLDSDGFQEIVNPEGKVAVNRDMIGFTGTPEDQFFFSDLSKGREVIAEWELMNQSKRISIRESANFKTKKINLWGWQHVVSPELFIEISLDPGHSMNWSRTYAFRQL